MVVLVMSFNVLMLLPCLVVHVYVMFYVMHRYRYDTSKTGLIRTSQMEALIVEFAHVSGILHHIISHHIITYHITCHHIHIHVTIGCM